MSSGKNRESKRNPDDTIKILIATDIHLDFEHNKKRGWFLQLVTSVTYCKMKYYL